MRGLLLKPVGLIGIMMPILTFSGGAILAVASLVLFVRGPMRSLVEPLFLVALAWFAFFGLVSERSQDLLRADLAVLLSFSCFCVAFCIARRGRNDRALKVFRVIWPWEGSVGQPPAPLSSGAMALCLVFNAGYVSLNLWMNTVKFGGLEQALLRLYRGVLVQDVSPWIERLNMHLWGVAAGVLFVLRLNYVIHRRGYWAFCLVFLSDVAIMLPVGAVGLLIRFPVVCVFADLLGSILAKKKARIRLDMMVLGGAVLVCAMVVLTVRSQRFDRFSDLVESISSREGIMQEAAGGTGNAYAVVMGDIAVCLDTFGKSEHFLWCYTPYSILVNPIPREVWPGKPDGFGAVLTRVKFGDSPVYTGVSFAAGVAGEGYANGGYAGIVLLSILVGVLCGKAAKYALVGFTVPSYPILMISVQLFVFSISFVRGDMLVAWTRTVYPLAVFLGMLLLIRPFVSAKNSAARWAGPAKLSSKEHGS